MKSLAPLPLALMAGAALAAAGASAQPAADPGRRVSQLLVYGNDPCPPSTDEVIVVCARRPEDDRYRIPEPLRGSSRPVESSWAANARSLEYVGRTGIQSCSTVGPGGFTGCWAEMMRQAREEREANAAGQRVP
ncbi:hypothetical protein [Allosphingosinicella sp.]|uniref:hypothetical protein n=1 Tax=Allosphingosinicella sp. TaxID=2823234 RepID=UPI003D728C53